MTDSLLGAGTLSFTRVLDLDGLLVRDDRHEERVDGHGDVCVGRLPPRHHRDGRRDQGVSAGPAPSVVRPGRSASPAGSFVRAATAAAAHVFTTRT